MESLAPAAGRPLTVDPPQQSIYLEVSNYCNSLCATCPLTFFGNGSPHNMGFDEFKLVVDQVPELKRAVLHGIGEPLLNPHLPRMIAYLKARGTHVVFNSNVILLTPRRQQQLIDAGLDEYRASLDASTADTYLKVRGVPAYERVLRNLTSFMETKRQQHAERPHVSLWFTTLRENIEELPGVVEFAVATGITEVHVQRLVYFGEGLAVEEQSLYKRLESREQELLAECAARCRQHGVTFSAAGLSGRELGLFPGRLGLRLGGAVVMTIVLAAPGVMHGVSRPTMRAALPGALAVASIEELLYRGVLLGRRPCERPPGRTLNRRRR